MKFNYSNIQTISVEGVAGSGKSAVVRYFLKDLLEEYSKKDFVFFGRKFGDFSLFRDEASFKNYADIDIELEVAKLMSQTEVSKVIVFSELDKRDSGKISQLIKDNQVHTIIFEGQDLSTTLKVDLELLGKSTTAIENFKGVNLTDLKMGQFWANRIMLLDFPYIDNDFQKIFSKGW